MTQDQVIAALVGAFIGSLASFIAEALLDRSRQRARAREAAAMLRAEIVRAQAAIAMLLVTARKKSAKPADLAGYALLSPPGTYFDELGLVVASQMPIEWFTHLMSLYARWTAVLAITRELEKDRTKITETERGYVEDWVRDADVAQEQLLLISQRWGPRRWRYGKVEREIRKFMREDERKNQGGAAAAGIGEYFRFVKFRRGK
jgi:hypothetical protein